MTIKEAHQFLDLPENADKKLLTVRFREKYNFFKMLHTNAPNAVIRGLQEKNLQMLEEIKKLIPEVVTADAPNPSGKNQQASPLNGNQQNARKNDNGNFPNEKPIAFLVVHTENKNTASFPLFEGENPVGRNEVQGKNSIVITDDDFVSRYHCTLIVRENADELFASIADDGRYNNNKPSLNGTYYNGSPNRVKIQKLKNGDTVQIGMTKMVFRLNNASKKNIEAEVEHSGFAKTIVINL